MSRGRRARRGGAILLEVVLSMAILVGVASGMMIATDASFRAAERIELQATAADLAASVRSRLQLELLPATAAGPVEFEQPAGWTWQIVPDPARRAGETMERGAGLKQVEIVVSNAARKYTYRLMYVTAEAVEPGESAPEAPMAAAGGGE